MNKRQKMVANDLPKAILSRPKQGFILPLDRWMRSSLKPCLEEVFFEDLRRYRKIGNDGQDAGHLADQPGLGKSASDPFHENKFG